MKHIALLALICLAISCQSPDFMIEKQLTKDLSYNHDLDNNDNFSPDDQWIVYDTRTEEGGIGACGRIEKVNVQTGEVVVMYELPQNQSFGPGVGAVSYSHKDSQVIFIHGLLNITESNPYQQWRRTGVMIKDSTPGKPIFMDARDVTLPYTPGALRGGTHRHEFSGDGLWVGYTYNDAILKQLEDSTGEIHNLRTIGVSKKIGSVTVDKDPDGENVDGEWFSALVVSVVANPEPGSDAISRAAGDSWVGTAGYINGKGQQQMARAFIGTTKDKNGQDVDEVFIVDIPEDITIPGNLGPLEGTAITMPAPPQGANQRRLTNTANSAQPGCVGIVRSAPDGSQLTYISRDEQGIKQIFSVTPFGGAPVQLTFHDSDVQSAARWFPDSQHISYIWNNSIIKLKVGDKEAKVLTKPTDLPPTDIVIAHNGKSIAFNRPVPDGQGTQTKQIFIINLD